MQSKGMQNLIYNYDSICTIALSYRHKMSGKVVRPVLSQFLTQVFFGYSSNGKPGCHVGDNKYGDKYEYKISTLNFDRIGVNNKRAISLTQPDDTKFLLHPAYQPTKDKACDGSA